MSYSSLTLRRVHLPAHLDAPRRVVAHVILVVDLAVQQLQADGHIILLRYALDPVQARDAVFEPFLVRQAPPIAGKSDDVRHPRLGGEREVFPEFGLQIFVIFLPVQPVGDGAGAVCHRADQAVFLQGGPVRRFDEVHPFDTEAACSPGEVLDRHIAVTPAGDSLHVLRFRDGGNARSGPAQSGAAETCGRDLHGGTT